MAPFSRLDLDPNPRTRLGPEYFRNLLGVCAVERQRGLESFETDFEFSFDHSFEHSFAAFPEIRVLLH